MCCSSSRSRRPICRSHLALCVQIGVRLPPRHRDGRYLRLRRSFQVRRLPRNSFKCLAKATFLCCRCCLESKVPTADACMCDYQQSSSALCFLNGVCSGLATCQKQSQTCIGSFSTAPLAICTVPGALTCTGTGSSEVDLTWFVFLLLLRLNQFANKTKIC